MKPTSLHLFAGLGGGSLGFKQAGFRSVGNVDSDFEACADLEHLTGEPATCVDIAAMTPADLLEITGGERPDVVFTSPPCKAFSGCLPKAASRSAKYLELSNLSQLGIWLALEAWADSPPPLIIMENVPRIQTRGREWLDQTEKMLRAYGYATSETTHDCGHLGGLAQSRRRFLLVARHMEQVPEFLYEPPRLPLLGVGEIFRHLPIPLPDSDAGGDMHRLPRLSAMNWLRLALIPAGGDWRDLPEEAQLTCSPRATAYGVVGWDGSAGTVVGAACHDNGGYSVADPRLEHEPRRGGHGVRGWEDHSHTVIGDPRTCKGFNVADGRPEIYTHEVNGADIFGPTLVLESRRSAKPVPIICATDATWHRPMTTLELAALQGFPTKIGGEWLRLEGGSHKRWRQRIGNAVPPPAARAIAVSCLRTLEAAHNEGFLMCGQPVWVAPRSVSI